MYSITQEANPNLAKVLENTLTIKALQWKRFSTKDKLREIFVILNDFFLRELIK